MSNLPPGVTDSMIPGNRPEDELYETIESLIVDVLDHFDLELSDDDYEKEVVKLTDLVFDVVQKYHKETG